MTRPPRTKSYKSLFWQEQTVAGSGNRVASSETKANHFASSEKDQWLNGVAGSVIADVSTPAIVETYNAEVSGRPYHETEKE